MKFVVKHLLVAIIACAVMSIPMSGQATPSTQLPPDFKSDGCTLFPDFNYRDCCVAHDKLYYVGGTSKERWEADKQLYMCIKGKGGRINRMLAPAIWVGARVGGVPFMPTPFRWGFGIKRSAKKSKEVRTDATTGR